MNSFTLILALLFLGVVVCAIMVIIIEARGAASPQAREIMAKKLDAWAAEQLRRGRL